MKYNGNMLNKKKFARNSGDRTGRQWQCNEKKKPETGRNARDGMRGQWGNHKQENKKTTGNTSGRSSRVLRMKQ